MTASDENPVEDQSFLLAYAEVEELLLKEDPPETPYESKYKARDKMRSLLERCEDRPAVAVNLLARLGAIDHEVEEFHVSQEHLDKALKLADGTESDSKFVTPVLVCLNQLGILWCTRGDFEQAKQYLFRALDTYKMFMSRNQESSEEVLDVHDLLESPDDERSTAEKKMRNLELLNTHTYFFLAQVHEKTGSTAKAGEYCHITLQKQLDLNEYKPLEWATNAYTLSHHYLVCEKFELAKHHIGAARAMLEKYKRDIEDNMKDDENLKEAVETASARIHLALAKYCYILLQKSRVRLLAEDEGDEEDENLSTLKLEVEAKRFSSLDIDPNIESISHKLAISFEEARSLFLPCQRAINAAKECFTFQEHCYDFVEANRELSAALKVLATFEDDLGRKFKIHKKRVALLEEPAKELNRQVYMLVWRQLIFELAQVHETLLDIKLDEGNLKGGVSYSKVNDLIDKAIANFRDYLSSLRDPSTGEQPSQYPADIVRPALSAHFHLARLWDKYHHAEKDQEKLLARQIQDKLKCLQHFRDIAEYCERNPHQAEVVTSELPVCQQMAELLPIKIERMKQQLAGMRGE